jgi:hypothetical protein
LIRDLIFIKESIEKEKEKETISWRNHLQQNKERNLP